MAKEDLSMDSAGGAEEEKKSGKKWLIIGIVAAVLLIGGGAAAFFLLGSDEPESTEDGASSEEVVEAVEKQAALYFQIKPEFKIIFSNPKPHRMMKVGIAVMTRDEEVLESIEANAPRIRNDILLMLSNQDASVLKTPTGKDGLASELLKVVQAVITDELGDKKVVEKIYFNDFIMQ